MDIGTSRVLHAGLHKTGSTFLQNKLFPNLEEVYYMGGSVNLTKVEPMSGRRLVVYSSEAACGYPYPVAEKFSTSRLAACVKVLGIDKVFIVNREFYSWCLSLYFQTLNEGFFWSLQDFIDSNRDNLFSWECASNSIASWCEEAGLEVHCESYEDLCSDPDAAIKRICHFIGVAPVNVQLSRENSSKYGNVTLMTYRVLNYLCRPSLVSRFVRWTRLTPRRLLCGRFGDFLEKCSFKCLSVDDVKKVMS